MGGERRSARRQRVQLSDGDDTARRPSTRWEEVPREVYDLRAAQGVGPRRVDAEVLFPNGPGGTFFQGDGEFEFACVRAYNDGLSEFASERSIHSVGLDSVFSPMERTVAEVERAVKNGHRGITMLA